MVSAQTIGLLRCARRALEGGARSESPFGCILSRMFGGRSSEQWIAQYASSHQHPVNRACHTFGIPIIVLSLVLFLWTIAYHPLWKLALGLFVFGWVLQFIGHAFEGKEPEFFHDWRFLFVGVRWWVAKVRGRA